MLRLLHLEKSDLIRLNPTTFFPATLLSPLKNHLFWKKFPFPWIKLDARQVPVKLMSNLPGPMECGLTNPARAGMQQR